MLLSHSQFARSTYVRETPFQGRFISSFSRFLSQCSLMCTGLCARLVLRVSHVSFSASSFSGYSLCCPFHACTHMYVCCAFTYIHIYVHILSASNWLLKFRRQKIANPLSPFNMRTRHMRSYFTPRILSRRSFIAIATVMLFFLQS